MESVNGESRMDGEPFMYGMIIAKCNLVDCVYIDGKLAAKTCRENLLNYDCGDGRFRLWKEY